MPLVVGSTPTSPLNVYRKTGIVTVAVPCLYVAPSGFNIKKVRFLLAALGDGTSQKKSHCYGGAGKNRSNIGMDEATLSARYIGCGLL